MAGAAGREGVGYDVIAEIDTDKVSAEIPTPVTGTVLELLASEEMSSRSARRSQ